MIKNQFGLNQLKKKHQIRHVFYLDNGCYAKYAYETAGSKQLNQQVWSNYGGALAMLDYIVNDHNPTGGTKQN
jgi:hypothetical protein